MHAILLQNTRLVIKRSDLLGGCTTLLRRDDVIVRDLAKEGALLHADEALVAVEVAQVGLTAAQHDRKLAAQTPHFGRPVRQSVAQRARSDERGSLGADAR